MKEFKNLVKKGECMYRNDLLESDLELKYVQQLPRRSLDQQISGTLQPDVVSCTDAPLPGRRILGIL